MVTYLKPVGNNVRPFNVIFLTIFCHFLHEI
jgi:hypothetical protein